MHVSHRMPRVWIKEALEHHLPMSSPVCEVLWCPSIPLDYPVHLQDMAIQEIHVEDGLSFQDVWKRYLKPQPKPAEGHICPGCCFLSPDLWNIYLNGHCSSVPESNVSKVPPHHPRAQPKQAGPSKWPQVCEPRMLSQHKQNPSVLQRDPSHDKSEDLAPASV